MKSFRMVFALLIAVAVGFVIAGLAACGSSGTTDSSSTDTRLISGELTADTSSSVSKATATRADGSVVDVVSVKAVSFSGEVVVGTLNAETNKWEISLEPGDWMIGFFDSSDELIGYLEVEGSTAFTIDSGNAIDLGAILLINGVAVMLEDMPGLGEQGFRSMHGHDDDFDGMMGGFDHDEIVYDPSIFSIIMVKPFNGQPDASPCRPIKLYFSQPVDSASVTTETLIVTDGDGAVISGEISYEVDDFDDDRPVEYEVKFAPDDGFALGATVNILATAGILNEDGVALDKEYGFSFTVRDFGGTSQVCHDMDGEHREMERERHRGDEQQNQEQQQNGMEGGPEGQMELE